MWSPANRAHVDISSSLGRVPDRHELQTLPSADPLPNLVIGQF